MNIENINDLLTLIIPGNNIKSNKDFFAYTNKNNITHSDTFDQFIIDENLNIENDWYFDTALNITKMGYMTICNIPVTNEIILFCPSINKINTKQKSFLTILETELNSFENINILIYDEKNDDFIEKYINNFEANQLVSNNEKVFIKKQ